MGNFFTLFAHATRMRIFCALEGGPMTVTRIAEEADISAPNASQHLRLMRDRGAVVTERQGQSIYYRMADPRFFEAANLVRKALDDRSSDTKYNVAPAGTLKGAAAGRTVKGLPIRNQNQPTTN